MKNNTKLTIAVLVSGGVDSSVALRLLKDQGHNVTAFYLKIWLEDELASLGGECPWENDLAHVRAVCEQAGVPLEVMSLQKEYWDHVVAYTIDEIKAGRTPNPDVLCNSRIKFGFFLKKLGDRFDKVASGHYAWVEEDADGNVRLVRSPDTIKDQTYFLAHLNQEQLNKVIFPIGKLDKAQVRQLAHDYDLPNKDRKDSQGICFLGKLKFNEFIKHYLGEMPGDIVEVETGAILGQHKGFWFHTIGQRQGLGLPGGPWYVVKKDIDNNIVYVSRNYYADDKKRDTFDVSSVNWFAGSASDKQMVSVKMRHGAKIYPCTLTKMDDDRYRVKLTERDQGIAPGQFAVFYAGNECLGSGVIQ